MPIGAVSTGLEDDTASILVELLGLKKLLVLGKDEPVGRGVVELQYLESQPLYAVASVPFVQEEVTQLFTTGPIGG